MPPRVLLQDVLTLYFFRCSQAWTTRIDAALDFAEVPLALDYALSHGLRGVRVVLKFADPHYDVELPLVSVQTQCN